MAGRESAAGKVKVHLDRLEAAIEAIQSASYFHTQNKGLIFYTGDTLGLLQRLMGFADAFLEVYNNLERLENAAS
jgi:hypothetical protein